MNKGLPVLLTMTILSGIALSSSTVSANNDEVIDTVQLTVPVACTMNGTGTTHTATLNPGTYSGASGSEYENGIGKTTLVAICNDDNGFAIYAIGFTGNQYEGENHTKLVGNNTNGTISTKAYQSGDTTSNWSMKLTKVTDTSESYNPQNLSILSSYDSWHAVPDAYTKVAEYHANTGSSTTDTTMGVKLETTYAAFISSTQAADTYIGQVKYTMVHPYNEEPVQPRLTTSGKICYYADTNMAEGTMGCQTVSDSATWIKLFASNYSREGYGFAGWSDRFDYATNPNAKFYGPQQDISFTAGQYTGANPGLSLYAIWIKAEGSFQDSAKVASFCANDGTLDSARYESDSGDSSNWSIVADLNTITAFTDNRDGQTYAVAKLPDDKCWMIENLRLDDTAELTVNNTNNPLNDNTNVILKNDYVNNVISSHLSQPIDPTQTAWCTANSEECNDQSRLATNNTSSRVTYTSNETMTTAEVNLFSHGNYYNWYSATAGKGIYSKKSGNTDGDICPFGWRLPTGNTSGDFAQLSTSMGGLTTNMNGSAVPDATTISKRFRRFPVNFLQSGTANGDTINNRGYTSTYWSSTPVNEAFSYSFNFSGLNSYPGSNNGGRKYTGKNVRCLVSY